MDYITLLLVLVIVAVVLAVGIIIALIVGSIKHKKREAEYDYEDDYDDEEEEEDDEPQERRPSSKKRRRIPEDDEEEEEVYTRHTAAASTKKQWKLILENLNTWEKTSIIFYDNIGIGRKSEDSEFEKYYVIKDDPRVSKLHCAIISSAGKLYLKDIGSSNGTFLNGQKITKPILIQKEDVIGVGQTQIEIKKVLRER